MDDIVPDGFTAHTVSDLSKNGPAHPDGFTSGPAHPDGFQTKTDDLLKGDPDHLDGFTAKQNHAVPDGFIESGLARLDGFSSPQIRVSASSFSDVVPTEIREDGSVERIQESSERDVVLQIVASSSSRADRHVIGVTRGSGKIRSFFDVPPLFTNMEISTMRRDGLKDFGCSECASEVGRSSRDGSLYDDVSSSAVRGAIWKFARNELKTMEWIQSTKNGTRRVYHWMRY